MSEIKIAENTEEQEFYDFMDSHFVNLPKKRAWWLPAHGFAVNLPLMGGVNLWTWNILPYFPERSVYLPAGDDPEKMPEGIVLMPFWQSLKGGESLALNVENAKKFLDLAKKHPTVGEITQKQLKWIESKFGIKIPTGVKATLAREAPKIAARRWGVDRVKTPNTFVPLDGRKPVPLREFGPRYKKSACRVANRYLDRLEGGTR